MQVKEAVISLKKSKYIHENLSVVKTNSKHVAAVKVWETSLGKKHGDSRRFQTLTRV